MLAQQHPCPLTDQQQQWSSPMAQRRPYLRPQDQRHKHQRQNQRPQPHLPRIRLYQSKTQVRRGLKPPQHPRQQHPRQRPQYQQPPRQRLHQQHRQPYQRHPSIQEEHSLRLVLLKLLGPLFSLYHQCYQQEHQNCSGGTPNPRRLVCGLTWGPTLPQYKKPCRVLGGQPLW